VSTAATHRSISWLPVAAAIVALIGLTDAIYLTIHHYTAAPVPCGEGFDCEMVLNSSWAEIQGIPLAAFGAASYFIAFSLALLTAFGDTRNVEIVRHPDDAHGGILSLSHLCPGISHPRVLPVLSAFGGNDIHAFHPLYCVDILRPRSSG
jgi:hypothetical protein